MTTKITLACDKPHQVSVPQIIVGGFRTFGFDNLVFAQMFAEETGGTVFTKRPEPTM